MPKDILDIGEDILDTGKDIVNDVVEVVTDAGIDILDPITDDLLGIVDLDEYRDDLVQVAKIAAWIYIGYQAGQMAGKYTQGYLTSAGVNPMASQIIGTSLGSSIGASITTYGISGRFDFEIKLTTVLFASIDTYFKYVDTVYLKDYNKALESVTGAKLTQMYQDNTEAQALIDMITSKAQKMTDITSLAPDMAKLSVIDESIERAVETSVFMEMLSKYPTKTLISTLVKNPGIAKTAITFAGFKENSDVLSNMELTFGMISMATQQYNGMIGDPYLSKAIYTKQQAFSVNFTGDISYMGGTPLWNAIAGSSLYKPSSTFDAGANLFAYQGESDDIDSTFITAYESLDAGGQNYYKGAGHNSFMFDFA